MRSKLEEGKEAAYMSRDLAQIHTDLVVPLDLEQAHPDHYDPAVVEQLFRELEFRTLITRLQNLGPNAPAAPAKAGAAPAAKKGQLSLFGESAPAAPQLTRPVQGPETTIVDTPEKLKALAAALGKAAVISFDTETTSTEEMRAELVGISLAVQAGKGWYIPVGHTGAQQLPLAQVLAALTGPLTDANIRKIGHNVKYDYLMLARQGLQVSPLSFDTMIAEWLIDPNSRNLGLKNLVFVRLGEEMTHIEELIGKGRNQVSMAEVPVENAAPY